MTSSKKPGGKSHKATESTPEVKSTKETKPAPEPKSTTNTRQERFERVVEESMFWLSMSPEQLVEVVNKQGVFKANREDDTPRDQLLRLCFLGEMKHMISG